MYWNRITKADILGLLGININMRRIEIRTPIKGLLHRLRLTLTWDVLKCSCRRTIYATVWRLTLTWDVLKCHSIKYAHLSHSRLTLTWDVLKFIKACSVMHIWLRLTLTWDVLKFISNRLINRVIEININMRCIEIVNGSKRRCYKHMININMRCIEMIKRQEQQDTF